MNGSFNGLIRAVNVSY